MSPRALIVSPSFPPINRVSSLRAYYLAVAFRECGYEVDVLATCGTETAGLYRVCTDMHVKRFRATHWVTWSIMAIAHLTYKRVCSSRDYRVVVSSYGPTSSHVAGWVAKVLWRKIAWTADYRDLWSSDLYYSSTKPGRLRTLMRQNLERFLIKRADFITTVSRGLQKSLSDFHARNVAVFPNGFERLTIKSRGLQRASLVKKVGSAKAVITIVYTGTINSHRSPLPVLRAIEKASNQKQAKYKMCLEVAGEIPAEIRLAMRPYLEAGLCVKHGRVERDASYALQDRADCCLLLESPGATKAGAVTGKVFEYMAMKKPIVAFAVDPASELAEIIESSRLGIFVGLDEDRLTETFCSLIQSGPPAVVPNLDFIARYDRLSVSRQLVRYALAEEPNGQWGVE